jgi:hypothetical protein
VTVCACGVFTSGGVSLRDAALFTDLYELTMAASNVREGMHDAATFSLFVRTLPPHRGFLVAAGLPTVLEYLESFELSEDGLRYLRSLGLFPADVLDVLADVRFTGSVRAVPEGTVVFEDEPLLEVTAPIIEAQLVDQVDTHSPAEIEQIIKDGCRMAFRERRPLEARDLFEARRGLTALAVTWEAEYDQMREEARRTGARFANRAEDPTAGTRRMLDLS